MIMNKLELSKKERSKMECIKKKDAHTKRFIPMCMIMFCFGMAFSVNGQSKNLEGTWVIDSVMVKKTVNNVVEIAGNIHSINDLFEMFAECPLTITFTADKKIIVEPKGKEPGETPSQSEGTYVVEGNKITRNISIAGIEYEYIITEKNKIQLLHSIGYSYNHGHGRIDKITEEYTFYGTKK